MKFLIKAFVIFVLIMVATPILLVVLMRKNAAPPAQSYLPPAAKPEPPPKRKHPDGYDASKKESRNEFVKKMGSEGLITSLKVSGDAGFAVVTRKFLAGNFDQKQTLASVLYAWCLDQNPDCKFLAMNDDQLNHDVGTYWPDLGLRMK